MLDERKAAILRAVVSEYIASNQPVGSQHIARAGVVPVSPATVRNEMAVLEQEGYLAQPHTSAGRVPTDRGYRFFVDSITAAESSSPALATQIRDFFTASHGALERMLADTSTLLSNLTHYAAVVVGPTAEVAVLRSVQVVGLTSRAATVVVVLSSGVVDHHTIELPDGTTDAQLADANQLLSAWIGHAPSALPALALHHDAVTSAIASAVAASLKERQQTPPVFLHGTSAMASSFDAVETVRQVLSTLEHEYLVVSLLRDVLDRGLSVAIGAEHGVEPLAACSVVVAPVVVEGERLGTVGVLGPTRMNYPQALAAVELVTGSLTERLGEG
jgi:heat-inducible transcriptional repressor